MGWELGLWVAGDGEEGKGTVLVALRAWRRSGVNMASLIFCSK